MRKRVVQLAILFCLVIALGYIFWTRGIPGGLSGQPALIQTPYKTERAWAVQQIVADIDEMGAFANKRPIKSLDSSNLPQAPWDPAAFATVAREAFGDAPASMPAAAPEMFEQLTALNPRAIVDAGNTVSKVLAANMRDARAHESAALVLGAFGLREAADLFSDARWALNRMTAHLAVAAALRKGEAGSPDGALAHVILSVLSNQQTRAAAQLDALGKGTPPAPLNAWVRALTLRLTQDWRLLSEPALATRVEKLEYFRALRATVRRRPAAEALAVMGEGVAQDFARIAQDSFLSVSDGNTFILSALDGELSEAADVYQLVHGRPMPEELNQTLNDRATRLVAPDPHVLPWGAWAEFYQRHLAMTIGMVDSHHRVMLGSPESADLAKEDIDRRLGQLTWFPLGTLRRTKGRAATEADMTHVARVVELTSEMPEIVTYRTWVFFDAGSRAEPVPHAMPLASEWFTPPSPEVPYEAGLRHAKGLRIDQPMIGNVIAATPTDRALLVAAAIGAPGDPVVVRARGLLSQRHDYDLAAVDAALTTTTSDEERAPLQRKACQLSSRDCSALAQTLAFLGDEAGAAAEYERAFSDQTMDGVALAADAEWLVDYYYRHGRIDDANRLAARAADSGSANGRRLRAIMFERQGQLNEAETDFLYIADAYQNPAPLLGFYYRRVELGHDAAYSQKWEKWRAESFPNGLQKEATSMPEMPKRGVFVYKDSERSRKHGLRVGDIIVGLEGWRVDNRLQYFAINSFTDNPHMKLTIWRGSLIKIEADMPGRLFGTELETHPLKGWIQ